MGERGNAPKASGGPADSGARTVSVTDDAATKRIIGRTFSDLLNDLTTWPESLRDVVKQHGGERVFDVGLKVLGYPPTWLMEQATAVSVIEAMKQ